jgi:hypothetical protein
MGFTTMQDAARRSRLERSNAIWHFYFGTKDFEQLGVSILNPWSE